MTTFTKKVNTLDNDSGKLKVFSKDIVQCANDNNNSPSTLRERVLFIFQSGEQSDDLLNQTS